MEGVLEDVAFLANYFSLDPEEVWNWDGSKRRLWATVVQTNAHYERRLQAVENARANAYAFFEPKELNKLLDIKTEIEQAKKKSVSATREDILSDVERIRRMKGSGSIHDPSREE